MHTTLSSIRRATGLLGLGAALALSLPYVAVADAPTNVDAFPSYESYIKISGQAPWITGDTSAFATRSGTPNTGSGGIEDLFYTRDLTDSTTMTINGRALAGVDDYLANIKFDTAKIGTVDVGYSRFRTFYDGIGGFFPLSDQFERWDPEMLHVDRSKFWADLKLALPDRPVFTLSYHNEVRTGMKDSTEWGPIINPNAVVVKGALVGTAAPTNTPYVAPNVQMLDEHHNIIDAGMVANIGKTEETLKLTYDQVNNSDERDYMKFPGSNVIADPTVTVQDDQEMRKSDSFRFLNKTETKLSERFTLETGVTYTHLSSTNGGSWITPTYAAVPNAVYPVDTAADIYGGSKFDDYVGNIGLDFTPTKDWLIKMEYRDEYDVTGSDGGFTNTTLAAGAKTVAPANIVTRNELTYSNFLERIETPELSLEYTGFKDLTLYANFDDRVNQANQHWINPYVNVSTTAAGVATLSGAPIGSVFFQDADQNNESMKVGANWNASSLMTLRAELYRKVDFNQFVGANSYIGTASYGALYATGYTFTGVKLSFILKPLPGLTFSTRYQPQVGMMSVAANAVTGGTAADNEITSGKVTGQMISETIDWAPTKVVYFQANANVVYNQIQTAYPVVVVSTTTYIPTPIQNSNNNYVASSALCGFVLDKDTDAQLQLSWVRADDYNPQIAAGGEPYGAGFLDECATAGLKHKFTARLLGEFKAGYLRRTDDTTGGFTNYHGPLVYASLTYSL